MLKKITQLNASIFDALVQDYEEEFSNITGKKKDEDGKYPLDADWKAPYEGFYWIKDKVITGFCLKGKAGIFSDITELYIIPKFRHQGIGKNLAFSIFDAFPGKWQVRQIEGATAAREFWRNIVCQYTSGSFEELQFKDPYWGPVTCQRFISTGKK